MKHLSMLPVAALGTILSLASCNKDINRVDINSSDEPVALTIRLANNATKASTSTAGEVKVNNLQILVFLQDGSALDAYGSEDDVTELTLSCTSGPRKIYAVCNAPDLSTVQDETELLDAVSGLAHNSVDSFEMIGDKTETLPKSNAAIEIPVDRLVARVVLKGVTKNFTNPALQAQDFAITGVYMINVAGDINYGLSAAPSLWYNWTKNDGDLTELLCANINSGIIVTNTYNTAHTFYVYPNPANVKPTRLVIEATLGGKVYYYPITLPEIEYNNSYEVSSLVVTRLGSDDPDVPVEFSDEEFSISVNPWTVVPITTAGSSDYVI